MIYYAYFHSEVTYGLLFWGNSSHSTKVFRLQMKTIRIMMAARSRDSCIEFFKILGILILMAQYIYNITVLSITESTLQQILNYMPLDLEKTRTYFSHNQIYLSIQNVLIMLATKYIIIFLLI